MMKTMSVCAVLGVLAWPAGALAETSFDAAQFGRMQGILNVCSRVNPQQASNYLLQIKSLIGDATKEAVDQATRSDEYQQAYQEVTARLGEMEKDELVRTCTGYLGAAK